MSDLFERIFNAVSDHIYRTGRKPTHIIMSYDLLNEVYRNTRNNLRYIDRDPLSNSIHIGGLKVIPVADNLLDNVPEKFILVSDETSKNFPQHPPLKWE